MVPVTFAIRVLALSQPAQHWLCHMATTHPSRSTEKKQMSVAVEAVNTILLVVKHV